MVIEVDGLRLNAQFLRPSGAIDDHFTIDKSDPLNVQPRIDIARNASGVLVSWPTSHPAFNLQAAEMPGANWQSVARPVSTNGRRNIVTMEHDGRSGVFRLQATTN